MHRHGFHYSKPFILLVNLPDASEGFIDIRNGCDERSSFSDGAAYALPIEGISPAIVAVTRASGAFQNFQEVGRPVVVLLSVEDLRQKSESHCEMGVSNRKSLPLPK